MNEIQPLGADTRTALRKLVEAFGLPRLEKGWVWLAGAGPGDVGLASLHALNGIGDADVIVMDALVNPELLKLARPDAAIVPAGKRGGQPSPAQDTISRALIGFARRGLRVVRLKGGDPFVFGRGAEEGLALARAGVPFRVVPGVTAGIGGLAYAGIPLTHRDTNHSVTFVTGSDANGRIPDLDWDAIARSSPTLVLYMARRTAGEIAAKLMAVGRPSQEPAAIISNASLGNQSMTITSLSELGTQAQRADTPAVIVLGDNVRLACGLDWLGAISGRLLDPDPLGHERLGDTG